MRKVNWSKIPKIKATSSSALWHELSRGDLESPVQVSGRSLAGPTRSTIPPPPVQVDPVVVEELFSQVEVQKEKADKKEEKKEPKVVRQHPTISVLH